jgi:hypothetical protein
MMETTQDRAADNVPGPPGASRGTGASLFKDQQNVAQMAFAEYDDMINAFPADRTDQPFSITVLPG